MEKNMKHYNIEQDIFAVALSVVPYYSRGEHRDYQPASYPQPAKGYRAFPCRHPW